MCVPKRTKVSHGDPSFTFDSVSSSFRSSSSVACSAKTDSSFVEGGDVMSRYDVSMRRIEVLNGSFVVSIHLLTRKHGRFKLKENAQRN